MKQARYGHVEAWWFDVEGLEPKHYAILCCLTTYERKDGSCFPSYRTLSEHCGCGRSTVKRCVDDLEKVGLLHIERGDRVSSNRYHVIHDRGVPPVEQGVPEGVPQLWDRTLETLESDSLILTPPIPPQPGPKKKSPTNLPDDFWPNEASQGCMVRNGLQVSEATKSAAVEVFRDMIANAKNPTAKDWQARFRTYCAIENFQRAVHARSGNEADQRRGNGRDPRGRGIIDAYRATEEAIRDGSIAECSVLGNSHRLRRSDYEP